MILLVMVFKPLSLQTTMSFRCRSLSSLLISKMLGEGIVGLMDSPVASPMEKHLLTAKMNTTIRIYTMLFFMIFKSFIGVSPYLYYTLLV